MKTTSPLGFSISRVTKRKKAWIAAAALLAPVVSLTAATLVEPFTSPVGGIPDDWVEGGRSATVPVAKIVEGKGLSIERGTGGANYSSAVYYTGSTGGIENGVMSDFSGQVTITSVNLAGLTGRGVMLRSQSTDFSTEGYFIAFFGGNANTPGGLGIWQDPVSHVDKGMQLTFSEFLAPIQNNVDYILHFSAIGSVLKAELTTTDELTTLASVEFTLGTGYYESGLFGVRVGNEGANNTYFKDASLTAIPEPGLGYMAVAGASLAIIGLRYRRRS